MPRIRVVDAAAGRRFPVAAAGVPSVLFSSEWRNSVGDTAAAYRDGTKWSGVEGLGNSLAGLIVAPDASLVNRGNYFRCSNNGTNNLVVHADDVIPAATSHFGRQYFRDDRTAGAHNHIIALGGLFSSPIHFVPLALAATAIGTRPFIKPAYTTDGGNDYPYEEFSPGVEGVPGWSYVNSAQWYVTEWWCEFRTAARLWFHAWISACDANGMITVPDLYTSENLFRQDYSGAANGSLKWRQENTPNFFGLGVDGPPPVGARRYVVGNEGPQGGNPNLEHFYLASFALSLDGRLRDMVVT